MVLGNKNKNDFNLKIQNINHEDQGIYRCVKGTNVETNVTYNVKIMSKCYINILLLDVLC